MTRAVDHRTPWWARNAAMLRFVGTFALILISFYAITATPWFRKQFFPAYLRGNASVAAWTLRALGEDAWAHDTFIVSPRGALVIKRGCDGIEPLALLIAGIFAFPAPWRARFAGACIGGAALQALNILRIDSLHYVQALDPQTFQTIHVDVWQTGFVICVLLIWIIWAWRITRAKTRASANARG